MAPRFLGKCFVLIKCWQASNRQCLPSYPLKGNTEKNHSVSGRFYSASDNYAKEIMNLIKILVGHAGKAFSSNISLALGSRSFFSDLNSVEILAFSRWTR